MKIYADYSLCKACGGLCCKQLPGSYHPNDFEQIYNEKLSVALLVKIFQTNKVAVDYYEMDPRYDIGNPIYGECTMEEFGEHIKNLPPEALEECYYLRPKNIKGKDQLEHAAWRDSACINWTAESGCSLPEAERPYQCRMVVPSVNIPKDCDTKPEDKASKKDLAIEWIPYQKMIKEAMEIFNKTNS